MGEPHPDNHRVVEEEADSLELEEDTQVAAEGNQVAEEDNTPAVAEDNSLAVADKRVPVGRCRQQAYRIWDNKWPLGLVGWHS